MQNQKALHGVTVLVIEDHPLIALDVKDSLERNGALVAVALDLEVGLRLADSPYDAAILDVRFRTGSVIDVCNKLRENHVPFVFHASPLAAPLGFAAVPAVSRFAPEPTVIGAMVFAIAVSKRIGKPLSDQTILMRDGINHITNVIQEMSDDALDVTAAQRVLKVILDGQDK